MYILIYIDDNEEIIKTPSNPRSGSSTQRSNQLQLRKPNKDKDFNTKYSELKSEELNLKRKWQDDELDLKKKVTYN
jgi:hypothetical protein